MHVGAEGVDLLMLLGFLHSNGTPGLVRLTARSDRPAPPSSPLQYVLLATTPWLPPTALQLSGST